ncbi:branched-chain amino acid ABC transporter permease [Amycolatopsis sp. A133]|jgi:branched-chain amino acid transport system permease protein|uniref:branched-chain amino acid ABC transporter permease n=1 Tax=unclassified Amycolatopsis TaxID=2618356 RepID=UPI0027FE382E|nr:branched-chain amino acid ABC transporter permease [Amycolatopsis sp. A133]MDQ7805603.1 branched-chain amino acid ABC transporter permease [Amycolatopsis sp. A133]
MFQDLQSQFLGSTIGGLVAGSIYALIALGYTMVYGVLRLINFAHSEIFMIGTMTSLFILVTIAPTAPFTIFSMIGILLLLIVASALVSGGSAIVLEQLAYRPLRKKGATRLAALISAIGASLFLQEAFGLKIIPWLFDKPGRVQQSAPRFVPHEELFRIGNGVVRTDHVFVIVGAVIVMVVLDQLVSRTRIGRGIRATAQDPEAAVLMGVSIDRIVRITFLLGGAMAGVAAALFVMEYENTDYRIGFLLGIKAFTAAVLGGIGNLRGALLGGIVLGLVENWSSIFLGSAWKDVTAFVVLVLVLMFRPTGILGESLQRARA